KRGFTMYVWLALVITLAIVIGAKVFVGKWPVLRQRFGIQSPTEYLKTRFGQPAQLTIAISGVIMKLLDIAAKWAAIGILLHGFTGIPVWAGVVVSGLVSMIYITIGGLWADLVTDFVQFIVQLGAGIVIAVGVGTALSERGLSYLTMWGELNTIQPGFSNPFNGDYTMLWCVLYLFAKTFEYNGGNWNLAARFISTANASEARKAAVLSATMYLLWPLLIFAPMWAARLLFPNLADPASELYPLLTQTYVPTGMVGLVLAAMFAATMGMTVSDINTLSAVTQRDIAPAFSARFRSMIEQPRTSLRIARVITVCFTVITIVIGLNANSFGGVLSLVISWFGAMVGVTGVPLLLGLFRTFRHTDGRVTIGSVVCGFLAFALTKLLPDFPSDWEVATPLIVCAAVFILGGLVNRALGRDVRTDADALLTTLAEPDRVDVLTP
ncbi:MAG: Na+:solute symporter, partial [Propionibacteriales bacterium]|nr:Na+:solute symporter [Propionibacteriales bacterium]